MFPLSRKMLSCEIGGSDGQPFVVRFGATLHEYQLEQSPGRPRSSEGGSLQIERSLEVVSLEDHA